MHRRDFLKITAISSLALAFPVWKLAELALAPIEVEYHGRIYRGLRDGDIHISEDQGQSWRKQMGFGGECPVAKLFTTSNGRLYAQLKYQDILSSCSCRKTEAGGWSDEFVIH